MKDQVCINTQSVIDFDADLASFSLVVLKSGLSQVNHRCHVNEVRLC